MRQLVFWLLILFIAAAMGGSVAYAMRPWYEAANVLSSFTSQPLPTPSRPTFTPTPRPTGVSSLATPTPTPTRPPIISPKGHTTYLLLGSDNDTKFSANGTPNTQVMKLVSFDTVHNQVYIITIPRDLFVPIPGYITDKIDTASGYDNLALAVKTVEDNFHVTVDHYAWVGLTGFVKIIDSLGGIDVNVTHPIVENDFPDDLDPNGNPYAYRRFFIPPGPQHLDGVTALEYVRARHSDFTQDIGRTQRQNQVLLQIKQKLKDADVFALGPNLVRDMKGSFQTDLSTPELLGLAHAILGLKSSQIHTYVLNQAGGYTTDATDPRSGAVLMPQWDRINALFQCVFSDHALKGCSG